MATAVVLIAEKTHSVVPQTLFGLFGFAAAAAIVGVLIRNRNRRR